MKSAACAIAALFAGTIICTTVASADVACPSDKLEDQSLQYLSNGGVVSFHGTQTTDKVALNRKIDFLYVLSKSEGAPEAGAILVKRIYDIPADWGDIEEVVTMRRNKERERRNFPASTYQNYHEDMVLSTPEIRRGFHVTYARHERTDDSVQKRGVFVYPESILKAKRKLAKPLIVSWSGFGGKKLKCLDFNLNEGEGDYGKIELFIYELAPRDDGTAPHRTVHLTILPKNGP